MLENPDPSKPMEKYEFDPVWHVDDELNTWNGNGFDDKIEQQNLYADESFVNSSNLIGFLGFTDEDIYNQKNRVKQTFIRLLFYDSKDPLTQNLLYYSTIFLDSGELFGRFVKRKMMLMEADEKYNEEENPVVWSETADTDTVSAVTSQIMVNDEYDMTKSGEGFNVYLFREGAPTEKTSQPIYMKVEFNHAGIGRTVPMIYWSKDTGGTPVNLTTENYLDNLYIEGQIALTEEGYVYSFNDVVPIDDDGNGRDNGMIFENDRLVFNLFEPMITLEDFED